MGFAEHFIASLSSHNLRDDALHHDLDVIAAAALAGDMGALLCRVKYADGTISRVFEGNAGNLAQLLRAWTAAVTKKGQARRWVKASTAWDAQAANTLYRRVAEASLAHWLDSKCKVCHGTRRRDGRFRRVCTNRGNFHCRLKKGAFCATRKRAKLTT